MQELSVKKKDYILQPGSENIDLAKTFVSNTALNILLKRMNKEERMQLYTFLRNEDYSSADEFIKNTVPNFNKLLTSEINKKSNDYRDSRWGC